MIQAAAGVIALAVLFWSTSVYAQTTNSGLNLTVQVNNPSVPDDPPPVIPSGGGGGGGGSSATTQTGVTVSGRAYPLSKVSVLRDGSVAATTIAGPDAIFSVTLSRISAGTHTISVSSEDEDGRQSVLFSFPLTVTAGAMTSVSGIFIAPTIDLDKSQVKQGDPLAVYGQTAPGSQVTITVHSEQLITQKVAAQSDGTYLYYVDTTPLEFGEHVAQAFSGSDAILSPLSPALGFTVGTENVARAGSIPLTEDEDGCALADINCDQHVDLVDYSILVYWYQRAGTLPERVDLNGDDTVSLTDMSILAYYWTG